MSRWSTMAQLRKDSKKKSEENKESQNLTLIPKINSNYYFRKSETVNALFFCSQSMIDYTKRHQFIKRREAN